MKLLVLDFETYYNKQYSLSKMTTEEYIRDERFEVIGVCVGEYYHQEGTALRWFSGTHEETKEFLAQFDWENCAAVAHNAMFDMAILSWRFNIKPARIIDTLSMARAVHGTEVGGSLKALAEHYDVGEKGTEVLNAIDKRRADFTKNELAAYGEYCKNDVDLTYKILNHLAIGFPVSELRLIDLTVRMFSEPVLQVAGEMLEEHLKEVKEYKRELLSKTDVDKDVLMSNPQLAELLRSHGVEPPLKTSLTTGKETYAFAKNDEEFTALLEHENLLVQAFVAARLGVKSTIEETRTQRFIDIAARGVLPIPLRYYAAHTGRWGGDDKVNMQNLPSRGLNAGIIKRAILPPSRHVFIDCDSSQIEARMLAWLAEQDDLVEAFDRGEDVYKIMASAIYNKPIDQIDAKERFVGKTTILGAGYGMGAPKFKAQLLTFGVDVLLTEAQHIIDVYRKTYPNIPKLWRTCGNALSAMQRDKQVKLGRDELLVVEGKDGIRLPNKLMQKYPNLRKQENEESGDYEYLYDTKKGRAVIDTKIYGGKVVENLCQALARIVIGEQMLDIARKYKVVMTVHDAVGCVAPEAEAEDALAYVKQCMRKRPLWAQDLPLDCKGSYAYSYGDCKD